MPETDLMTRLAAPETLWQRHDSYCELEETYDHQLRAETDAGDLVIVVPPDHEDSDGDRDYCWRLERLVNGELVMREAVPSALVVGLVPRRWESWVLDETAHAAYGITDDLILDIAAEDADAASELRHHRTRLTDELRLAQSASHSNKSGDREQDAEWAVTGIPGRSGVALEWRVFGRHAEAQEPIGFRERRVLRPPSTTHSNWTVERRYPNTPDDAAPDVSHEVTTDELLRHLPADLEQWVRARASEALEECQHLLLEKTPHALEGGYGELLLLVRVADELRTALNARVN